MLLWAWFVNLKLLEAVLETSSLTYSINIQLFQLTLSDESLSLRDKTAGQYGILMP